MMKKARKKRSKVWLVVLCLFAALTLAASVFMRFGGFGTGESASPEEFAAYAGTLEDIFIPENAKIIALGEATHGNVEFQELKLDVFIHLVENYGVRSFALEGDYGGCEQVNRYIHGGEGTARQAAAAIGFAIYRTEEMAELISFMREYNDSAEAGDDLRFYGFDMQRYAYSFQFLMEACAELDVDTGALEKLMDGENWSGEYDDAARMETLVQIKTELAGKANSAQAIRLAAMLLQYLELQNAPASDNIALRDRLMAENVQWIAEQERLAGHGVSSSPGITAMWLSGAATTPWVSCWQMK